MGTVVYGTHVFTKFKGYYGGANECDVCHKVYERGYVKLTVWFHLDYIPIFPIKRRYIRMCPICGRGVELKSKEARKEMLHTNGTSNQNIKVYAKHSLAKKPKGILSVDSSYEAWVKDLNTGEEICIGTNLTKDNIKEIKRGRGLKKLEIQNV